MPWYDASGTFLFTYEKLQFTVPYVVRGASCHHGNNLCVSDADKTSMKNQQVRNRFLSCSVTSGTLQQVDNKVSRPFSQPAQSSNGCKPEMLRLAAHITPGYSTGVRGGCGLLSNGVKLSF